MTSDQRIDSVVILGGGQAGATAARALREQGYAGSVTLVSEETRAPYERPALSKAVLAGRAESGSAHVMSDALFASLNLDWRPGVRAERLHRDARQISLSDGTKLAYDKLIFCTGGRAHKPQTKGFNLPQVFTLRTLDDCLRLKDSMQRATRICIVGGGWIGLEVASTAIEIGKSVVLLERGERLCSRSLPPATSEQLLTLHRTFGVDVRFNAEVASIDSRANGVHAMMRDGSPIPADLVVVAAGLVANDELAREAGIACARGIVVSNQCVTSDPNVLAAGDVAVAHNSWAEKEVRLESWANARDQAEVAAKVALGGTDRYDPLPWFWSDQHGLNLQIYGMPGAHCRAVTRPLPGTASQITFLVDGDLVKGVVASNAARELRMSRRLIEERVPVHDAALSDPRIKLSSL